MGSRGHVVTFDSARGQRTEGEVPLSRGVKMEYGVAVCQGCRAYMEDRYAVVTDLMQYAHHMKTGGSVDERTRLDDSKGLPPRSASLPSFMVSGDSGDFELEEEEGSRTPSSSATDSSSFASASSFASPLRSSDPSSDIKSPDGPKKVRLAPPANPVVVEDESGRTCVCVSEACVCGHAQPPRPMSAPPVEFITEESEDDDESDLATGSVRQSGPPGQSVFVGVFDGHGGSITSTHISHAVVKHLVRSSHFPSDMGEALDHAMIASDHELWQEYDLRCRMDGSTCLSCVVHEGDLWVANLGDSRAVLCRDGKAVAITVDHKPDEPGELSRIERVGGVVRRSRILNVPLGPFRVYRRCGLMDVQGGLALSRGLGDFFYKSEGLAGRREDDLVSSMTDVFRVTLDPLSDQFCILATDGLWDVFTPTEAVRYVQSLVAEEYYSCYEIAESLINSALRKKSTDNITVIVLRFQSSP